MTFTNENIRESLQDALREYDATDLYAEASVHYLLGYLSESIRQSIAMLDRMEQDKKYEKYRQQEEKEFLSHLGKF